MGQLYTVKFGSKLSVASSQKKDRKTLRRVHSRREEEIQEKDEKRGRKVK